MLCSSSPPAASAADAPIFPPPCVPDRRWRRVPERRVDETLLTCSFSPSAYFLKPGLGNLPSRAGAHRYRSALLVVAADRILERLLCSGVQPYPGDAHDRSAPQVRAGDLAPLKSCDRVSAGPGPFPPRELYESGMVDVGDGHCVYCLV